MKKTLCFTLPILLFGINAFGQSVACVYSPDLSYGVEVRLRVNNRRDSKDVSQKVANLRSRVESISTKAGKDCSLVEESIKLSNKPLTKKGTLKGTFHFKKGANKSKCNASLRKVIQNPSNKMFEDGFKFEELNFCTNHPIGKNSDESTIQSYETEVQSIKE